MERKSKTVAQFLIRTAMSLSVFGLLAIAPAMADSYATHLSTSVAQTNAGNMANTQASTQSYAMGYGRQSYYNRHLMPDNYYGTNWNAYNNQTPQGDAGGGGSTAPAYKNVHGQTQHTGGATHRPYGSTGNQGMVQTFKWGVNGKLKNSTTKYK